MILYFTGTGNSRFVANRLGELLSDQVVSVNEYLRAEKCGEFTSEKPYVIVTPTYMSRMPMKVQAFLKQSTFAGNKRVYFVFTAGQAIGNAHKCCEKLAKEKQLEYCGTAAVAMPANYVVMYDVTPKEKADEAAQKAIPAIEQIAEAIKHQQRIETTPEMLGHKSFSVFAPAFNSLMVSAKAFYADEHCVGCGTCASVCPLNNIQLKDGKPVWGNTCMHCMACISICPQKAIEYGKKTQGRNRYYLADEKQEPEA